MAIKYKNIVGTGFDPYVKKQLEVRSNAGDPRVGVSAHNVRSNNELQYLTNRNAYFRLSSSTQTSTQTQPKPKIVSSPVPSRGIVITNESINQNALQAYNDSFSDQLAKDNVLQGGTIGVEESVDEDNNKIFKTKIRKGFNETYKIGDGGTDPSDDLGLQPMPGIVGITVGTGGKWQTLMQADIEIIAYNLDQLNVIQKLYMSLGITCFLEWGHTPYFNNASPPQLKNELEFIDFFNYKGSSTKLDLAKAITQKRHDTKGNYDAFLGTVYNFSYDGDKDGAYLCKIQLMGAGGMLESLKINTAYNIDFTNAKTGNKSDKYSSTLDNALASMRDFLQASDNLKSSIKKEYIFKKTIVEFGKLGPEDFYTDQSISKREAAKNAGIDLRGPNLTSTAVINIHAAFTDTPIGNWGTLLNSIYNSTHYSPINFEQSEGTSGKLTFKNDNDPFKYGNAHQVVTGKAKFDPSTKEFDGLSPLDAKLFSGYVGQWGDQEKKLTFITLGHLMAMINLLGIFVESNDITGKNSSPVIYLDFHPDNTAIDQGDLVASINPHVCLVPFISNFPYDSYFNPLDINKTTIYSFEDEKAIPNNKKKLMGTSGTTEVVDAVNNINKINKIYPPSDFAVEVDSPSKGGKLFNTLVNIDFARKCLKSSTNTDGETSLLDFLTKILNGINQSLGSVNNLRPFTDECGFILRIIDEKLLEPITDVKDKRLVEIPSFGLDSLVYEGGFNSAITPKLASQIVISTQAAGGGIKEFEEDVLSYQKINQNVKDRFSSYKFPSIKKNTDLTGDEREKNQLKSLQRLYDQFYYNYSDSPDSTILESDCKNMTGPYKNLQGKREKTISSKDTSSQPNKSSILIPLQYSITLDGISGILPYNAFLLPADRLPQNYLSKADLPRVAFAVFSINHTFENNNWFTTLRGQTLLLEGSDKSIEVDKKIKGRKTNPPKIENNSNYGGYPKKEQITFTSKDSPKGEKVTTVNDTTPSEVITQFGTVTTGPDGLQSVSFGPASNDQDINAAFTFIADNESNGIPDLKAYTDKDYTSAATTDLEVASYPFTYRIGFGSDTVTNTDGSVTKVVRSSRITKEQAALDLKRRIKIFKSKVVGRLNERGVNYDSLPLEVKVVFLDLAYNYGTLFYDFINAWKNGGKGGIIAELNRRIARGESQVPSRRLKEINYLNK